MSIIYGVDPGKMTGVCVVQTSDDNSSMTILSHAELDVESFVSHVEEWAPRSDVVVCEKFTVNARTARTTFQPYSLEVIGMVRSALIRAGRGPESLILQAPSAAKNVASNDALRDLGLWYRGGAGHANDAARHVALYLLQRGYSTSSLKARLDSE